MTTIKKSISALIVGLSAILLILAIAFGYHRLSQETKMWKDRYYTEQQALSSYRSEVDGTLVSYKKQIEIYETELRNELKSNDSLKQVVKHYRKLASAIEIKTEWKHDTIRVPLPVYILGDRDTTVNISDSCFKANLTVYEGGVSLNNFYISNHQNIIAGVRKVGLFKSEYAFDVVNSNPCIRVTGMNSYKVVEKRKFWNNPVYVGIATFAAGVYLGNRMNQ